MAKRESQTPSRSQSQPRTPSGHFNTDGMSQGKKDGAVRPTPDANNDRKDRK